MLSSQLCWMTGHGPVKNKLLRFRHGPIGKDPIQDPESPFLNHSPATRVYMHRLAVLSPLFSSGDTEIFFMKVCALPALIVKLI